MANTPKTKAEEIAAGVEKEMKRLARESVDTEDVKGLLDSEGETKRRLLNLLKKANKQAKPDTTLIKDIKKNIEAENIHLKKLEAALKDNESFKSRLDKGVAKSRIISEQAAAEPDALSQGTAKLSGKAQTIRVDGAELDSIVQSYTQRMSDVVTKMRALGLPVKEFTAKTTKILDKFIEEINADSGLKGKDKLTQRAKKICLIFAKQHKSNIEKAAGISPVALLVTSLKTKAKQGIADKIKSIPGMGAMDSLARMMGVKTLSEKLTPKGYDQNLAREQRMDSAEIGAGSAEGAQGELEGRGWGGANAETALRMRQESPTETFASKAESLLTKNCPSTRASSQISVMR